MNNKTNWFDFKPEKITGWGYFGRSVVGIACFILLYQALLIASRLQKSSII